MKKIILDAYEKNLEEELEKADGSGLLKSTLTPSRAKALQQTAHDTMTVLRHGGKRTGAGRPKIPSTTVTRSISMPRDKWETLDNKRGALSRGKFIAAFIS
jgi:hypothetical protein